MASKRRAFTVIELTLACTMFGLLSLVLVASLRQVSGLWGKTSAKDDAVRNLLKAKASLVRDLPNSSGKVGQWAIAPVGPNLGSGRDSDALTFLSTDSGASETQWSVDPLGKPNFASQITYYCVIPNRPAPGGLTMAAGAADAEGYEQQHPYKWLIRRVDPGGATINAGWTAWLTRPPSYSLPAQQKLVSDQLLQLRVLRGAPMWTLELRAVSVIEARRKVALGSVPLSSGPYTVVQQFSVPTNN